MSLYLQPQLLCSKLSEDRQHNEIVLLCMRSYTREPDEVQQPSLSLSRRDCSQHSFCPGETYIPDNDTLSDITLQIALAPYSFRIKREGDR